ncbi:alkaline phosphatase [Photobacterium sp. DNB23_23_1]
MNHKLSAVALATSLIITGCNSSSSDGPKTGTPVAKAKNVILMISDGASDGAWDIASFYEHGELANKVAPYNAMEHRYAMTTYPLNTNSTPAEDCTDEALEPEYTYDPEKAWDDTRVDDENARRMFKGYEHLNDGWTDSAAAGTALATGTKSYNQAISVNNCGEPLKLITEYAKEAGMSTGVVSSVNINHATLAVFGTTNTSRYENHELAYDMLTRGHLDLIMGTGHPHYDNNGDRRSSPTYSTISEEDWEDVLAGKIYPKGSNLPWSFMDSFNEFTALANDYASAELMEGPLLAMPRTGSTMQQSRSKSGCNDASEAFGCELNQNMPSLKMMTQGALNYLSQNENGFFVMVEGGAVDWAAHANDTARIIEEQIDFNDSVSAVIEWVEANSSWDETLLIVTTDHGNSYVLGDNSDIEAYAAVENAGAFSTPEVKYFSGDHTTELVRLYAKGAGAALFKDYFDGHDPYYAEMYRNDGATGDYFDNTNVFDVMKSVIDEDSM